MSQGDREGRLRWRHDDVYRGRAGREAFLLFVSLHALQTDTEDVTETYP